MRWAYDKDFIRGSIPMTKFDIRVITIAELSIKSGDNFLDIGAGTGSISIQAALEGAEVYAVEREDEAFRLIRQNADKFNVNINLVKGQAPYCLCDFSFNKCFIGGSGGALEDIFAYLDKNLQGGGILCANFITLKNLNNFTKLADDYGYKDIEVKLVQSSKVDKIGLLRANNPVFIVKGIKSEKRCCNG